MLKQRLNILLFIKKMFKVICVLFYTILIYLMFVARFKFK